MNHPIQGLPLPDGLQVNELLKGSARCPCCDQLTILRLISLSTNHIKALRAMVNLEQLGEKPTANDMARLGRSVYCNYTQLKYWRLIEEADEATWRVTELGYRFYNGVIALPRQLGIFNDAPRETGLANAGFAFIHEIKTRGIQSVQDARDNSAPIEYTGQ